MGSGKGSPSKAAGASGSPQSPGSVCCMCGDRGLLPELFRCCACSIRSQHTYCTDRYPKAESYGTCNWCLTADGGATSTSNNSPRSAGKVTGRPAEYGDAAASGDGRSPKVVAARGDFASSNLSNKPIKKQYHQQRLVLRRSASDLGSRVRSDRLAPPSPGVTRGRPRVRRYKLLEEVITAS